MPEGVDMFISVAIPTYGMFGVGVQMLERSLEALERQTFKDFEVVISDNSDDDAIKKITRLDWNLNIAYFKNPKKGMAVNTNHAIEMSTGELVKILYQDDYLAHDNALQVIVDNFTKEDDWLITACSNNPFPHYSQHNTLGSPSVLTMRNGLHEMFDEKLKWILDLDLYRRLYAKYGEPKIINDINVVMGLGEHQQTNHLSLEEKLHEERASA